MSCLVPVPPIRLIAILISTKQEFSVVRFRGDKSKADAVYAYVIRHFSLSLSSLARNLHGTIHSGCEPLTPEDIAEVVVFAAGRRENVVIADTLIYPSHQAGAGAVHKKAQ